MANLSQSEVRDLFTYADGELKWRANRNNRARKGRVAGCLDKSHGYIEIRVNYQRHYAHRLIWVYFNGEIPKGYSIDHINHSMSDNRIDNLRLVSHQENHKNQRLRKNNKSGALGVHFDRSRKKWVPKVMVSGTAIYLGRYDSLDDAIAVRKEAGHLYGFHGNHGKVAAA